MPESENVSKNATPQEETKKETTSVEDKYTWMVRPCEIYKDEYNDCTSIRARFHQYFVFGEPINCKQWNTDYKNCKKWNTYKSKEAYDELIESEKKRRWERLQGNYYNDIWQKRDKPPENWNTPLPDWIIEQNKGSYLKCVSEKIKNGETVNEKSSCTLM